MPEGFLAENLDLHATPSIPQLLVLREDTMVAFFWYYSEIGINGIDGIRVLLGHKELYLSVESFNR